MEIFKSVIMQEGRIDPAEVICELGKRPKNSPITQHREINIRKHKRKIRETEERSRSFHISLIRVQKGQNRENEGR